MKNAKLGISAALTTGLTIHTKTFVAAINDAMSNLPVEVSNKIELEWFCDKMSAQGGQEASRHLIDREVHAVIGHFSSRAAAAAIPNYLDAKIPLILPCSSQDDLTAANISSTVPFVFRLSSPDAALMIRAKMLVKQFNYRGTEVSVWAADSVYAKGLMKVADNVFGRAQLPVKTPHGKTHLLLGHHDEVLEKIQKIRKHGCGYPIVILDDAIDADLGKNLDRHHAHDIFGIVSGLKSSRKGAEALQKVGVPFYRETYMAVEIAALALIGGARKEDLAREILSRKWSGAAGLVTFDLAGENQSLEFSIWEFKNNDFLPSFVL